jgi:hypothetical protein
MLEHHSMICIILQNGIDPLTLWLVRISIVLAYTIRTVVIRDDTNNDSNCVQRWCVQTEGMDTIERLLRQQYTNLWTIRIVHTNILLIYLFYWYSYILVFVFVSDYEYVAASIRIRSFV